MHRNTRSLQPFTYIKLRVSVLSYVLLFHSVYVMTFPNSFHVSQISFCVCADGYSMLLLTQQTGHNGYQSRSCSQLQHLLSLQVHPLPVVVQEGAQSQRLQDKEVESSNGDWLMLLHQTISINVNVVFV